MTTSIDLLTIAEMAEHERPVRIPPPVPDLESQAPPWRGSATSEVTRWRVRAESAERLVAELRRALQRYRVVP